MKFDKCWDNVKKIQKLLPFLWIKYSYPYGCGGINGIKFFVVIQGNDGKSPPPCIKLNNQRDVDVFLGNMGFI